MQIHCSGKQNNSKKLRSLKRKRIWLVFGISSVLLITIILWSTLNIIDIYRAPYINWKSKKLSFKILKPVVKSIDNSSFTREMLKHVSQPGYKYSAFPGNYIDGLWAKPDLMIFEISKSNFEHLKAISEEAVKLGILESNKKIYVNGTLSYNDTTYNVRLRLKGDWADHLRGNKWSFRVRMRNGKKILGMKEFSVQHPGTRNYLNEWIYHKAMRREGVMAPKSGFIKVVLNGNVLGVYALEEHFRQELIEAHGKQGGFIMKFSEDSLWAARVWAAKHGVSASMKYEYVTSAEITAFNMNRIENDSALKIMFKHAQALLFSFRAGKLPTHKVFEIKPLAKFLALSEVLGAFHGAGIWHNLRYYYNPETQLFVPIAFDGMPGEWISETLTPIHQLLDPPRSYMQKIFNDPVFRSIYYNELKRFTSPDYIQTFLNDISEEMKIFNKWLHSSYPYYNFTPDVFYENQEALLDTLKNFKAYSNTL